MAESHCGQAMVMAIPFEALIQYGDETDYAELARLSTSPGPDNADNEPFAPSAGH